MYVSLGLSRHVVRVWWAGEDGEGTLLSDVTDSIFCLAQFPGMSDKTPRRTVCDPGRIQENSVGS